MAKIKFGMMMTDARGKLGGQVFSKNRGGAYVRTKVTPSNPQTLAQSVVRANLSTISQAWNALSVSQIANWNTAVDNWKSTDIFGDIKIPSGKNLFTKLNVNLLNTSRAPILDVPEKENVVISPTVTVSYDATADTWNVVGLGTVPGVVYQVEATPAVPNGVSYVKNRFRVVTYGASSSAINTDLVTAYPNKFGALTVGDKVFFRIRSINENGQASLPIQVLVTIS